MPTEIPLEDSRPEWLIANQAEHMPVGMISVNGRAIPYTVIKHGVVQPELPYAVGFDRPDELFISEDVPPEDRAPILRHAVREKTTFSASPEEDRATNALVLEFQEVEGSRNRRDYEQYVQRRANYLTAKRKYYEDPNRAADVSPQFREGLVRASAFANRIARSLRQQ